MKRALTLACLLPGCLARWLSTPLPRRWLAQICRRRQAHTATVVVLAIVVAVVIAAAVLALVRAITAGRRREEHSQGGPR